MRRAGDCWDNTVNKSFFATIKKELVRDDQLVSSTRYVWTNRIILHEVNELTGVVRSYLRDQEQYAVIGHVDTDARGNTIDSVLYVLDAAGAIETAFNQAGDCVFEAERSIYGDYTVTKNDAHITQRLCNQYADEEVGLAYNLYRWYDPRLGLFVTTDPWHLQGNINPRDYSPNPLRWCDPVGLFPHPGVGTGAANGSFHPSPPNPVATIPAGVDGLTRDYLSNPGHWARDSTANPPGYANCPASALDDGSGFGSGPGSAQHIVDTAGDAHGCHSCGATESGWPDNPDGTGHWTCDHQPPRSSYSDRPGNTADPASRVASRQPGAVRLYPHCKNCASKQGGKMPKKSPHCPTIATSAQAQMASNLLNP